MTTTRQRGPQNDADMEGELRHVRPLSSEDCPTFEQLFGVPMRLQQEEALGELERNDKPVSVFQLTTGAGKTRIGIMRGLQIIYNGTHNTVFLVCPQQQLQRQFFSEVEAACHQTRNSVAAFCVFGKDNYPCRRRLEIARNDVHLLDGIPPEDHARLTQHLTYLADANISGETRTTSFKNDFLSSFQQDYGDSVWMKIKSEGCKQDECLRSKCPFAMLKKHMRDADRKFVVISQQLLVCWAYLSSTMLKDSYIVIDEAHSLLQTAQSTLSSFFRRYNLTSNHRKYNVRAQRKPLWFARVNAPPRLNEIDRATLRTVRMLRTVRQLESGTCVFNSRLDGIRLSLRDVLNVNVSKGSEEYTSLDKVHKDLMKYLDPLHTDVARVSSARRVMKEKFDVDFDENEASDMLAFTKLMVTIVDIREALTKDAWVRSNKGTQCPVFEFSEESSDDDIQIKLEATTSFVIDVLTTRLFAYEECAFLLMSGTLCFDTGFTDFVTFNGLSNLAHTGQLNLKRFDPTYDYNRLLKFFCDNTGLKKVYNDQSTHDPYFRMVADYVSHLAVHCVGQKSVLVISMKYGDLRAIKRHVQERIPEFCHIHCKDNPDPYKAWTQSEGSQAIVYGVPEALGTGLDMPGRIGGVVIAKQLYTPTPDIENYEIEHLGVDGQIMRNLSRYNVVQRTLQSIGRIVRSAGDKGVVLMLAHSSIHYAVASFFGRQIPIPRVRHTDVTGF